jgi:hypothetical protein
MLIASFLFAYNLTKPYITISKQLINVHLQFYKNKIYIFLNIINVI